MSEKEGIEKIIMKNVFEEEFELEKEKLLLFKYSGNEKDLKDKFSKQNLHCCKKNEFIMRIKLKYKMQILSYFWAYDPTNIHYDEIYNVKIEIINTSFHGLEIQFHRNMQYMWRNYMKEYMKEVYKKGVK